MTKSEFILQYVLRSSEGKMLYLSQYSTYPSNRGMEAIECLVKEAERVWELARDTEYGREPLT